MLLCCFPTIYNFEKLGGSLQVLLLGTLRALDGCCFEQYLGIGLVSLLTTGDTHCILYKYAVLSEYWALGRTLPTWVLQGRGGEEHTEASLKVGCAASRIRPEISILNTLDLEENIQFSPAEVNAVGQHKSSRS